jgi:hypothetical protein
MKRSLSEEYFSIADNLAGRGGTYYPITERGEPSVVAVGVYDDVPEPGHVTGFSFGLSGANHREWIDSRPELIISVKSIDHAWALCMGEIVKNYREESLFSYGTILHFREIVADDSRMTSFLIFECTLLKGEQHRVVLPDRTINWSQMYPVYESEAAIVRQVGAERFFWELGVDFYDVHRQPVQLE